MEPIQMLTNICYLDSVQSSRCRCVFVKKKCRVVSCRFVVMELEKILSFHASKYPMKLYVFRQDYHDCLNVHVMFQNRLTIFVIKWQKVFLVFSYTKNETFDFEWGRSPLFIFSGSSFRHYPSCSSALLVSILIRTQQK